MVEVVDPIARRSLALAHAIAAASPGEKAAARRMGAEGAPVFWRQVARLNIRPHEEAAWLRIVRLIALLTPSSIETTIHDKGRFFGAVLAAEGFSEQRLARLLAVRGSVRDEALERAIRMISRSRPRLDVVDLARFALGRDINAVARAYYHELDRKSTEAADD